MLIIPEYSAIIEFIGGEIITRKVFYRVETMYYLSPQIVDAWQVDDYWMFTCSANNNYKVYKNTLLLTAGMKNALARLNFDPYIDTYLDITKCYQL